MSDSIGKRLKQLRSRRGMTLRQLAACAHVPQSTLSMVETGARDGDNLTIQTGKRLAWALGVSLDVLAGTYEESDADDEPPRRRPSLVCAYCDTPVRRSPKRVYAMHFCTASCRNQWYAQTFATRFWAKVEKTTSCWLWQGAHMPHDGYGTVQRNGKSCATHRVAWELTLGPIPKGLWVLHRCDIRLCVRPDHLWLGTNRDNVADMVQKGRHNYGTSCGDKNGQVKLKKYRQEQRYA